MTHPGERAFVIQSADKVQVEDPSGYPPPDIVQNTDPFVIWTEFELLDRWSHALTGLLYYSVTYFAEGWGAPPGDRNLGPVTGRTKRGQYKYGRAELALTVPPGTLADGLYEFGAIVSFSIGRYPDHEPTIKDRFPLTAYSKGGNLEIYQP